MPNIVSNITTLPTELQTLLNENPQMFVDIMTSGMPWINEHFTVIESDGRTPLWNMEVVDFLRPAGDNWLPQQALKLGAKVPNFQDIDGDLEFPRSEILKMARSHVKKIAGAPSLKEAIQMKPFSYAFLSQIAAATGSLIETKGLFKGVRSASPTAQGTNLSMDGLNLKIGLGVASGDIPTSNVHTSVAGAIDETNAYTEVQELCQKTESNVALDGTPLNFYLSPSQYRAYCKSRRIANPNIVGPGETPDTIDDFDNIKFIKTPGLSGTQKHFISVKGNLFFCVPEGFMSPAITMVEDVKLYKTNILLSASVEYNFGKMLFTNTKP